MGSRAVVILCRDEVMARKRFGVAGEGLGIVFTRTGRRFFDAQTLEKETLSQVHAALSEAGFWEEFDTDWVYLDAELMPWSAKAQALVREQYAAVGAAARAALREVVANLDLAVRAGVDVANLLSRYRDRQTPETPPEPARESA